jgi:hypothetical protein
MWPHSSASRHQQLTSSIWQQQSVLHLTDLLINALLLMMHPHWLHIAVMSEVLATGTAAVHGLARSGGKAVQASHQAACMYTYHVTI